MRARQLHEALHQCCRHESAIAVAPFWCGKSHSLSSGRHFFCGQRIYGLPLTEAGRLPWPKHGKKGGNTNFDVRCIANNCGAETDINIHFAIFKNLGGLPN